MDGPISALYLSPHLDDAVLSCGGTMAGQISAGHRVVVVTLFAGSPRDPAFTPHSRELYARWNRGGDPVAARREEDLAALASLGAEAVHLPFLDAVYRTRPDGVPLYPERDDIFGPIHPWDADLPTRLVHALSQMEALRAGAQVCAPLGAGGHVDHVLVREVGLALARAGHAVRFYEDYPYSGDDRAVERGMAPWPVACWARLTVALTEAELRQKGDAVAQYASQISTFWADEAAMRAALDDYARRAARSAGSVGLAETFWRLDCRHHANEEAPG